MKVLVLGIADFSYLAQNTYLTLKKKFPKTEFYNAKKYRRLTKYIYKSFDTKMFNEKLYLSNPDLIVIVAPYFLKKEYFEIIKEFKDSRNCIVVGWVGDKFEFNKTNSFITSILDKKFITDSYFYDLYKNDDNIIYLPLCTSKDIFYRNDSIKKDNFSVFVAANTPYRQSQVEKVEFPLNIYGSGWKKLKKNNRNENLTINAKRLTIFDVSKQYNKSKTVLNLTNENNLVNGLNQRSFDPFLCDSLVFQEDCKDLELSFEPEKEIVVFKTIEELSEKIKRLSKDKELFKSILESGRKKVFTEHTFENRIQKIIKEIS